MSSGGTAGGDALGGLGDILSGQSKNSALDTEANQNIQNAQEAEAEGQYNANRSAMQSSQKIGTITANGGANGVASNSGSLQAILGASASNAELDRLNILHSADLKAIQYENQASIQKLEASSASTGGLLSGGGMFMKAGSLLFGKNGGPSNEGADAEDAEDAGDAGDLAGGADDISDLEDVADVV